MKPARNHRLNVFIRAHESRYLIIVCELILTKYFPSIAVRSDTKSHFAVIVSFRKEKKGEGVGDCFFTSPFYSRSTVLFLENFIFIDLASRRTYNMSAPGEAQPLVPASKDYQHGQSCESAIKGCTAGHTRDSWYVSRRKMGDTVVTRPRTLAWIRRGTSHPVFLRTPGSKMVTAAHQPPRVVPPVTPAIIGTSRQEVLAARFQISAWIWNGSSCPPNPTTLMACSSNCWPLSQRF